MLYRANRMIDDLGDTKVYFKKENLNYTGAHKINNIIGQCLLAKKMGKTRVTTETSARQQGVVIITLVAYLGLECEVCMGEHEVERQTLNVYRIELLGAKMHMVKSGIGILKNAVNETLREWTDRVSDIHNVIDTIMAPLSPRWSASSRASSAKRSGGKSRRLRTVCRTV